MCQIVQKNGQNKNAYNSCCNDALQLTFRNRSVWPIRSCEANLSRMDTESHYSLLRDKLDALGFHQPLPIGSLAIVSALLNDLVLTTKHFKDAKTQINQLNKVIRWNECIDVHRLTDNVLCFRKRLPGNWASNHINVTIRNCWPNAMDCIWRWWSSATQPTHK